MSTNLPAWQQAYLDETDRTRDRRLRWFHDARFGMFIHWGLYSLLGRHEWAMNRERIPLAEYEKLAGQWKPKRNAPRAWARLARAAGMKYMVLTTKHHEGFSLWDSALNPYNAVKLGPKRDLVREFVEAARAEGLRIGFYYSLMDWHHPDGHQCGRDPEARQRFLAYTQGLLRELMTQYGKIDILWYDVSWPLNSAEEWDSYTMNRQVRALQPGIIINDRSQLPEDLSTPEEHITPAGVGRGWEACMTFNGAWGFVQTPPEDWHSARKVLDMLRTCVAGGGNLLLNIGPKPDGSVPEEAVERLTRVGRWLKVNGKAVYGRKDRLLSMEWIPAGGWTRDGNTLYFWCARWPGRELAMGGLSERLRQVRLLPDGEPLPFTQTKDRLVVRGLPARCPDRINQVAVLEMKFVHAPVMLMGAGCEPTQKPHVLDPRWTSPPVPRAQVSVRMPAVPAIDQAPPARLDDASFGWMPIEAKGEGGGLPPGLLPTRERFGVGPGLVYIASRFRVRQPGEWTVYLGHDAPTRLWIDGKAVFTELHFASPCVPARSAVRVKLGRGVHEFVVVMDASNAWGLFLSFGIPPGHRVRGKPPVWPDQA